MSVINRIEIANWLNLDRTREWNPDYRHIVIDLKGQSTAVQAQNGTGKTRTTQAILALLGRDREFTSDARGKMAPRTASSGSHIRIEVLHPRDDGTASPPGTARNPDGECYVFGMFGYSGEGQKIVFYKFDGALQACPVAHREGHRVTLAGDEEFRRRLRSMPGALIDPSAEEWMLEVGKHFDRGNIRQMIEYQKKGAGDGTADFFKIKRSHGERYDEAFFFSVLAPELLVGTMGTEAMEGERRFEDTILISARKISLALAESKRRQAEMEDTKRALAAVESVNDAARRLADARGQYETECKSLAGEAAFLASIVVERPVPGVPRSAMPQDAMAGAVAARLLLQDGAWLLPADAIGEITAEEEARLNERASKRRMGTQITRSKALEIPGRRGSTYKHRPGTVGYTASEVIQLIDAAPKMSKQWSKNQAHEAARKAFAWATTEADTNFARAKAEQAHKDAEAAAAAYKKAEARSEVIEGELASLQARQRGMDAARHAYDAMARSGLFTDDELRAPEVTGASAEQALLDAEASHEGHLSKVAANEPIFRRWKAFVGANGDSDPGLLADEIEAAHRTANERLEAARRHKRDAEARRRGLDDRTHTARSRQRDVGRQIENLIEPRRLAQRFAELFPGESFPGLLERVKRELTEARERKARLTEKIANAEGPLGQLAAFRKAYPGEAPSAVSTRRARRRDELVQVCSTLETNLTDVRRRRSELERAQVAAGAVEHRILEVCGADARPVHHVIDVMKLPADRRRIALTHFSGLLFAPVLDSVEEADLVARLLSEEKLAAPVFVRSELEAFCRDGTIHETAGSAYTYILGARTRPVDCLLDPELVAREKRALEDEAARLKAELAAAQQERAKLAVGHPESRLIEDARRAEEQGLEAAVEAAQAEIALLEGALPRLEARASEESTAAIRGAERFASAGGETRYAALVAEQEHIEQMLSGLADEMRLALTAIDDAEQAVQAAEELYSSAAMRSGQVAGLRDLSQFKRDGGPDFMKTAPSVAAKLRSLREHARQRTRFDFDLAQQRVNMADGEEARLDAEVRAKSDEKRNLRAEIAQLNTRRDDARKAVDQWRPKSDKLEEVARRLIAQHHLAQGALADLEVTIDSGGVVPDELRRAMNSWLRLTDALKDGQSEEVVERADELREDVEALDLRARSKDIRAARATLEAARKALHGEIRKALDDQDLRFSSNERHRLESAHQQPALACELYRHLEEQWRQNSRVSEDAHATLLERRRELATTLKNMTIRLYGNYEAMRRILHWKTDSVSGKLEEAGVQIKAVLHSEAETEALLNQIVENIEQEEHHRRTQIEAGQSDVIPSQDQHDTTLKERIRLRFYRGMFSEPEIRIRHPELRAGEAYRLDDKISTGQQNAVMLLLLLKLADFAIDRDVRLYVKESRARRRARALAQKVVIIDGLFSNLSNRELIKESLKAMAKVRGNFQLIGLIHNPHYQNDPDIFPNHVVLARMKQSRSGSYVYIHENKPVHPVEIGRMPGEVETVSLHVERAPGEIGR
jgi:hypothetical protein